MAFFVCYILISAIFKNHQINFLEADSAKKENTMAISQELLDILACPKCKGDIYLNDTQDGLICDSCKLLYEIRDDIPIMLIDEARPIEE
jgi:uncharacterized protein YbaR (Trm112 family)